MSRIGKRPIEIPAQINVAVENDNVIFETQKTKKILQTFGRVKISLEKNELFFAPEPSDPNSRAFWGTYRALAQNIVTGLATGFVKTLEINGVGYKAAVSGKILDLALGFSHPIKFAIPEGIEISVDKNQIIIKGDDKQRVGQIAAEIRAFRPPEPYKGKGIRYAGENIIRKAGKTAKKK